MSVWMVQDDPSELLNDAKAAAIAGESTVDNLKRVKNGVALGVRCRPVSRWLFSGVIDV